MTEKILTDFSKAKDGVLRRIPLRTPSGKTAEITDIAASLPFRAAEHGDVLDIRLKEKKRREAPQSCELSYRCDVGADNNPSYDELYFYLIGPDLPARIETASFEIIMPKNFEDEAVRFAVERAGRKETAALKTERDGKCLRAELQDGLAPREALLLEIRLPEGYFDGTLRGAWRKPERTEFYMSAAFFLLALAAALFLHFKNKRPPVFSAEPPGQLNPADLYWLYTGDFNAKSLGALLLDWAGRGIIRLEGLRLKRKKGEAKEDVKLSLAAPAADDFKPYENLLYEIVKEKAGSGVFRLSGLKTGFAGLRKRLKKEISMYWQSRPQAVFSDAGKAGRKILTIAGFVPSVVYWYSAYQRIGEAGRNGLIGTLAIILLLYWVGIAYPGKVIREPGSRAPEGRGIRLKALVFFLIGAGGACLYTYVLLGRLDALPCLAAYLATAAVEFTALNFRIYTGYGKALAGRADAYRRYLQGPLKEAPEDEFFFDPEDGEAFFKGLPYAFVLGLSRSWAGRFAPLAPELKRPQGLASAADFTDPLAYQDFIHRSFSRLRR